MTPEEALDAAQQGRISLDEYCSRDTFASSGDTQMCYYYNNPEILESPETYPPGGHSDVFDSWRESPTRYLFTYEQAYAAWQSGMPYYLAFCLNYIPVTSGGVSQCEGIEAGTVDAITGEYVGP